MTNNCQFCGLPVDDIRPDHDGCWLLADDAAFDGDGPGHSDHAATSQDGDYSDDDDLLDGSDGDGSDNDCDDEQAPAPTPSSPGAGAAVSLTGPVPPSGPVGGAALDDVDPVEYAAAVRRWRNIGASRAALADEAAALADARARLLDLAERDPCPDCGAETGIVPALLLDCGLAQETRTITADEWARLAARGLFRRVGMWDFVRADDPAADAGRRLRVLEAAARDDVAGLLGLAGLSLSLGTEARATVHPDGRPESVATHSHMLAMVACSVASDDPAFDVGLVAQFALIHDVTEVAPGGPGDIDTFLTTDPAALADRAVAEARAAAGLAQSYPGWLGPMIARYRQQDEPEARLVRYLDKVMPKATLVLSACAQFVRDGVTRDYFEDFVTHQRAALDAQYPELAELCGSIYEAMNDAVRATHAAALRAALGKER